MNDNLFRAQKLLRRGDFIGLTKLFDKDPSLKEFCSKPRFMFHSLDTLLSFASSQFIYTTTPFKQLKKEFPSDLNENMSLFHRATRTVLKDNLDIYDIALKRIIRPNHRYDSCERNLFSMLHSYRVIQYLHHEYFPEGYVISSTGALLDIDNEVSTIQLGASLLADRIAPYTSLHDRLLHLEKSVAANEQYDKAAQLRDYRKEFFPSQLGIQTTHCSASSKDHNLLNIRD